MKIQYVDGLPGVFTIISEEFNDHRGMFIEAYRENVFGQALVQGNLSISHRNVVRGLHYQIKAPQGKLMRTVHGVTKNIIVDMREGSPTLGHKYTTLLHSPSCALWVPPGFANGFVALRDETVVYYECSTYYHVGYDRAVNYTDPHFDFIPAESDVDASDKDRNAPYFADAPKVPRSEWSQDAQPDAAD